MEQSIYHSILRTSALSLSLALLFVSGVVSPVTKELSQNTTTYVASAIGMYAAVEPNGINEVTAALTQKETELDAREAALRERELSVGVGGTASENAQITLDILKGVKGHKRNAVLLNAGASLYIGGKANSIKEGVYLAAELIDSNKALDTLEAFIKVSNS